MKKTLLLFLAPLLFMACSKSKDAPVTPDDGKPKRIELNIETLNGYIGQSFDVVSKTLEKSIIETSTSLGDRNFSVIANFGDHKSLFVNFKETNKVITQIGVLYKGEEGGKSIGDPYENDLWYDVLNKVQDTYGESSSRGYIKSSSVRAPANNAALIKVIKDNGYRDAAYLATWNTAKSSISVFHSALGRFNLDIKATK